VPLKGSITWSKFKTISKDIATLLEEKYPDKYTSNIRKSKRKGKIFIDYLRNTKGATSVCPYSLRARNKQAVSMPIKWSELDKIKPDEIDIKKALKRLKLKDPWEDFFD
jgi:bifunctional non-homologous end joining protein LigD